MMMTDKMRKTVEIKKTQEIINKMFDNADEHQLKEMRRRIEAALRDVIND